MKQKVLRYAAIAAGVIVAASIAVYVVLRPKAAQDLLEANGQVRGTEVTLSAKIPGVADS